MFLIKCIYNTLLYIAQNIIATKLSLRSSALGGALYQYEAFNGF